MNFGDGTFCSNRTPSLSRRALSGRWLKGGHVGFKNYYLLFYSERYRVQHETTIRIVWSFGLVLLLETEQTVLKGDVEPNRLADLPCRLAVVGTLHGRHSPRYELVGQTDRTPLPFDYFAFFTPIKENHEAVGGQRRPRRQRDHRRAAGHRCSVPLPVDVEPACSPHILGAYLFKWHHSKRPS